MREVTVVVRAFVGGDWVSDNYVSPSSVAVNEAGVLRIIKDDVYDVLYAPGSWERVRTDRT